LKLQFLLKSFPKMKTQENWATNLKLKIGQKGKIRTRNISLDMHRIL